jgi:hypothetical protein
MLGFAELLVLPFEYVYGGRPAEPVVGAIHLRQQRYVPPRVFGRKTSSSICHGCDDALLPVLANQPRHLWQAQSRDFAEVSANRSTLLLALCGVLLRHQHALHEAVQFGPVLARELD